jgi:hypothetical protein
MLVVSVCVFSVCQCTLWLCDWLMSVYVFGSFLCVLLFVCAVFIASVLTLFYVCLSVGLSVFPICLSSVSVFCLSVCLPVCNNKFDFF